MISSTTLGSILVSLIHYANKGANNNSQEVSLKDPFLDLANAVRLAQHITTSFGDLVEV